jgi:hypothetical protein
LGRKSKYVLTFNNFETEKIARVSGRAVNDQYKILLLQSVCEAKAERFSS